MFNPIFEKNALKPDNWTIAGAFKDDMPEMMTAIFGHD